MRFVKGLYIHPARIMTARILLFEDEFLTGESLVFAQNNSAQEWGILIFLNLK
jgi:hypothetical protein